MIKHDQEYGGTMTPQRSVISSSPSWLASEGDEIMPPFPDHVSDSNTIH